MILRSLVLLAWLLDRGAQGPAPDEETRVGQVVTLAYHRSPLTAEQFAELGVLTASENPAVRVRALTGFFYLRHSIWREDALSIARSRLSDPVGPVRQYGLSVLDRLGSPDVVLAARALKHDPHEGVRERAAQILEKRSSEAPTPK